MNNMIFRENTFLSHILGEVAAYYLSKTTCPKRREELQATVVHLMEKCIPEHLSKQNMDVDSRDLCVWTRMILSGEADDESNDSVVPLHIRSTVNHLKALYFTFLRFEQYRCHKSYLRENRLLSDYAIEQQIEHQRKEVFTNEGIHAECVATSRGVGILNRHLNELTADNSAELDTWIRIRNAVAATREKNRRAQLSKQARESLQPSVFDFFHKIISESKVVPKEDIEWFLEVCVGSATQQEIANRYRLPPATLSRRKSIFLQSLFQVWTQANSSDGKQAPNTRTSSQSSTDGCTYFKETTQS